MATIAIIEKVDQVSADTLDVVGIFTDQATFKTPFRVTLSGVLTAEQLRQRLVSALAANGSQGTLKKVLQPGAIVDLAPPAPPDPVEPTAQQLFLTAYQQLQSAQRKVAAGVIAADAKEVSELLALVVSRYDVAFVGSG